MDPVLDSAYVKLQREGGREGGREGEGLYSFCCSLSYLPLLPPLLPSTSCSQLHVNPEQRAAILRVLGQVHIDDTADEDIKGKEQFQVHILL